jgi:ATP-dependent DNA helicase RecQ
MAANLGRTLGLMNLLPEPLESHLERFGLTSFRPGQRDVIEAVVAGHDCLCIMPTGGGKSLCYQLPSIAREGTTLVISPLIALMKDQVDALQALGLRATCINSSLGSAEQYERVQNMAAGAYDLVYVAPERLRNPRFLDAVRAMKLQLLAVDEAHCISEWGHDFRPDYARLGRFRERLGNPQTIALTATATPTVRADVVKLLGLKEPQTFITGFARPNLRFEVQQANGDVEKDQLLLEFLRQNPGSGIIYAATRKRCEELVERIGQPARRKMAAYHAGLTPDDRRRVQDDFMSGRTEVIVATNAFGMGIDKAALRFVVHYNMPGTLEAYYQEAGRAGRDGLPARCLLLFGYSDSKIQEYFIENKFPSPEAVAQVYQYLRKIDDDPIEITLEQLKERLGLDIGSEGISACEQLLEKAGALERMSSQQNAAAVKIDSDLPTLVDFLPPESKVRRKVLRALENMVGESRYDYVYFQLRTLCDVTGLEREQVNRALRELMKLTAFDYVPPFRGRALHVLEREKRFDQLGIDFDELDRRKAAEYAKLDCVTRYARTRGCRQLEILQYFGDPDRAKCGNCDNCGPQRKQAAQEYSPNVVECVRMVLSGVARTHGRVGKGMVAKMLTGSQSKDLTGLRLDKLSTFGLLSELKQTEAVALLDALISAGLIDQVETQKFRPLVTLSERGADVMRGVGPLTEALALEPALLKKLQRRAVATPMASTPVTTAQAPPPPVENVPASPPVPPVVEPPAKVDLPASVSESSTNRPNYYWTWKVLSAGLSVDECRHIRGLSADEVLDHALRAVEHGLPVELSWFLSAKQADAIEQVVGDEPPERIRPLLARLPKEIRYEHVQLFLRCRLATPS